MKLKEIDRTAMQAWSPAQHHPIYLATGTSAQQLDATFSTNASLEIFELDLTDPSLEMKSCAIYSSAHRYHKLIWGPHKVAPDGNLSGVLIAGGENGNIILYDPAKIMAGDSEVVIAQKDKHTGPVRALDVNLFQTNLVASGANESEIYIWDLNNFATPMTPGAKTQPPEDISCIAWNRQVQHILASASPSGRATVWDLRKNEPIIKVSDHSNRMHCSGLAWHPDVATQMVLASEDDRLPVIQMWDLRFASSPFRVLENHARGVLTIAWSMADPELLLSCGKDAKILCSNPNTGEVLYELPTNTQWCFDIQWCPRNPALLSAASFDGRISVYSIMGGSTDSLRQKQADKLSSSFGNLDPFGTGQPLPPLQLPQQTTPQSTVLPLKKPPKWIRRPVGATFSFGGKLVTFENTKPLQPGAEQQPQRYHVYISQVVTEKEFLKRSDQLQEAVRAEAFVNYCQKKIDATKNDFEKNVWSFLKVHFEEGSRGKYLELLGYKREDLGKKIAAALSKETLHPREQEETLAEPDQPAESDGEETVAVKDHLLGESAKEETDASWSTKETFNISVTGDIDGLITQALLTGNFESAVDLCLHDNRMADAIILAIAGGQELLSRTQKKYFAKTRGKITRLITAVVTKNWREIVQSCDLHNWKEALAAVLTYARPDEFAALCDLLGSRLESEGDSLLKTQACLCYICAGNVEKLVACWTKAQDGNNPLSLQDLIEKVVILRKAVQLTQAVDADAVGALLAEKMSQYANLLASQGSISAALAFLPANTNQPNIVLLRDRICRAQELPVGPEAPKTPYERQPLDKGRAGAAAGPMQMPQVSGQQYYQQVRVAPTVTTWSNKTPTALPSHPSAASPSETQGENPPPPPGFIVQGNINPNVPPHQPTSSGYNMYTQVGPRQAYPQPCQPEQQYSFRPGGPPLYQPQQPLAPPASASYVNPPPLYNPSNPPSSMPSQLYPAQPQASPTALNPSSSLPPPPSGASFQHVRPGVPASTGRYALPPGPTEFQFLQDQAGILQGPQNGWNDPPALNRVTKKKKTPDSFMPPVPITSPIMNPLPDQQGQLQQPPASAMPPAQAPFQPTHLSPGPLGLHNTFQNVPQPVGQPLMPPAASAASMEGAPGAPIGNAMQHVQSLPTEKITKKPIPEEHLILKTTFEALIQRCLSSATDPQTKRKLDDANKRLEFLYDKLRDQTLSPVIINGLHNIARSIETRNYMEGLNIHTHIVSTSNFSETSAFMPVLKVVLTQANKLGV
ncbi:protein transport protein Sec31A isoform X3 [Sphaerodactylus townsendi]|uniref:protein transport protein Sec31A isoform X3 n=1 Tax=Sphaerodactylus townsendi TaxID=933632 RepID=UPI002025FFD0|nr:protein transport protein Sec31A isoform X3 [Sphaerodactylus townsendi]